MKRIGAWFSGLWATAASVVKGERGGVVQAIMIVALVIIVLGALIPVLWPMLQATSTNITAISGTDSPTVFLKALWPIVLIVVCLGIVVGIVFFALKRFGVTGKGKI